MSNTTANNTANTKYSQYALDRITKDFGSLEAAKRNSIQPVKAGIKFIYRSLDGQPVRYIPSKLTKRSNDYRTKKAKRNDLFNPYGEKSKHLAKDYYRLRIDPQLMRGNSGKYKAPAKLQTGFFESLFLTNSIIDAYKEADKVDTLYLTEGEAKAVVMSQCGMVSAGFAGVSVFSMTDDLIQFVEVCRPESIVILYDSDALDLSKNWEQQKEPINARPLNFLSSARKFSKQFFQHIMETYKGNDYAPSLYFARNIETENQKAIDDMIINLPDQKENIISNLHALENSDCFEYLKLKPESYATELQKYFCLDNIERFYNLHKEEIKNKTFKFGYNLGYRNWKHNGQSLEIEGTKPEINIQLKKGQKLSDIVPQLLKIIKQLMAENGTAKIDLCAPMGVGKTYTTINHLSVELQKLTGNCSTMCCPLNMLAQQTATAYQVEGITGTPKAEQIQAAKEKLVFAINHNALPKIEKEFENGLNIFIDESHTLISGSSYKPEIIRKLNGCIDRIGTNVIGLSATPTIYPKLEGFQRINILQPPPNKTTFCYQKSKDNKVKVLKKILSNRDKKDVITVAKIQDKNKIIQLRDTLINQYGYDENEIKILYSEKHIKQSKHYEKLKGSSKESNSFDDSVKIVLCTSFINEGVNIYAKNIEFINWQRTGCFDPSDLVQFVGRWRTNKNKVCFSFHPATTQNQDNVVSKYAYTAQYKALFDSAQAKTASYNIDSNSGNLELVEGVNLRFELDSSYIVFDEKTGEYRTDKTAIIRECEKTRVKYYTTENAFAEIAQMKGFECVEVTPINNEIDKQAATAIKHQSEILRLEKIKVESKIISLIENDLLQFVGAVKQETEKLDLINLASSQFPELDFEKSLRIHSGKLVAENKKLFTDNLSLCEKTVKNLCTGISLGFDKENILQLLTELKPVEIEGLPVVGCCSDSLLMDSVKTNIIGLKSNSKLSYLFEKVRVQLLLAINDREQKENVQVLTTKQKDDATLLQLIQKKLMQSYNGSKRKDSNTLKLSDSKINDVIRKACDLHTDQINKKLESLGMDKIKNNYQTISQQKLKRMLNSLLVVDRVGCKEKFYIWRKDLSMLDQIKNDYNINNYNPKKLLDFVFDYAVQNSTKTDPKQPQKQPKKVSSPKQPVNPYVQGVLSIF